MTRRRALIIGVTGQDGSYLARLLRGKGYDVHGTTRRDPESSFGNLERLGIAAGVTLHRLRPNDPEAARELIGALNPNEIYLLAGPSSVARSFEAPADTFASNAGGAAAVLEAMRTSAASARLFFAASSECFGNTEVPADLATPFRPANPYGAAKASAFGSVSVYRRAYGLHACSGILFNHESPLRPEEFVSRKIVAAAVRIAGGSDETLRLGDLSVRRDWGWAPEYVEAMWMMLQRDEPRDFVIATGQSHSVEEFVAQAFDAVGLDWRDHVTVDPTLRRSAETFQSLADVGETGDILGWRATSRMPQVVRKMIDFEKTGVLDAD